MQAPVSLNPAVGQMDFWSRKKVSYHLGGEKKRAIWLLVIAKTIPEETLAAHVCVCVCVYVSF